MKSYFQNIQNQIEKNLGKVSKRVDIAVAWFTNKELFDQILQLLNRKVEVNLILINDSINNNPRGLDFKLFINGGGNLFFAEAENLMHHKFVVIDDRVLINGSYNWTYFAEHKNHENILVIDDADIIHNFSVEFKGLLEFYIRQDSYVRNSEYIDIKADNSMRKLLLDDLSSKAYMEDKSGNYSKAISLYETALEVEPQKKELEKAISVLRQKNASVTVRTFDESSFLLGTSSALNESRIMISEASKAYRKKDYDGSLMILMKTKQAFNSFAELEFWIALCYWKKGLFTESLKSCANSISLNSGYALAYNLKGIIFYEQKKLNEAIKSFTKSIGLNSKLYKSYLNRGLVQKEKGESKVSNNDFKRCLEVIKSYHLEYPNDSESLAIQGSCLLLLGKLSEAKASFLSAKRSVLAMKTDDVDQNVVKRIESGLRDLK